MNDELTSSTETKDSNWAADVPFLTLEDKINATKKASNDALKPLSESGSTVDKTTSEKNKGKNKSSKKGRKAYLIFLSSWLVTLIAIITVGLIYFYHFLEDYEIVYQESLPYHTMDKYMEVFNGDMSDVYELITDKPETSIYENKENVIGYMSLLLEDKKIEYEEAIESTDKIPVYNITADGYLIGKMNLKQASLRRSYDLPIYEKDSFEFYTDPGRSIRVKVPETCSVYLNDVKVSDASIYQTDTVNTNYFDEYTTLPAMKYYKVSDLYEDPKLKIVSSYGDEVKAEFNNQTGVYEVPYFVSKETEEEMISFAKSAVKTYTQVITREVSNQSLYGIFTKNNEIVKSIILNDSSFKWFPNHKTTDIEDEIIEFIPYNEDAFYCEIKHTQHMLIYGVRPSDEITDTRFYYVKENGEWKIVHITY